MAQDKRSNLGKLITQAIILVSLVSFFFSGNAIAAGGELEKAQKNIILQYQRAQQSVQQMQQQNPITKALTQQPSSSP